MNQAVNENHKELMLQLVSLWTARAMKLSQYTFRDDVLFGRKLRAAMIFTKYFVAAMERNRAKPRKEFEAGGIVSGCKPMSLTGNCEYIIPKK